MSKLRDLTGKKFGRLAVLERAENKGHHVCWKCRCDCGKETVALGENLISGHTKSCGCLANEVLGGAHTTHGMRHSKNYRIWCGIKSRCLNPNVKSYCNYSGRGVTIFPEWVDNFQAFFDYISQLPRYGESNLTLDRVDNNGNYEPGNLRWATPTEQARNRRSNHIVEYKGRQMALAEAAELSGIAKPSLQSRVNNGCAGKALFSPVRENLIVEYDGEQMCLAEASKRSGICHETLRYRLKKGYTGERLFRPVKKS